MEMDIRGQVQARGVFAARGFLEPAARAAGACQTTHRTNNQKIKENIHVNRTDGTRK